jgi:geranylgeranyl diphosphate synthase type I
MKDLRRRREQIREVLEELKEKDFSQTEWGDDAVERLVDLSCRGKMFRGTVLLETCRAMDGPEPVKYAAALELVHTGLLIHDDIMDEDKMRRGQKSVHMQYRDETPPDSEDMGENMAICAGDIAFFLAFELIATSEYSRDKSLEIFSRTFAVTGAGQIKDLENSHRNSEPSRAGIEQLYRNKTALYSFSLPMRLASILSHGEDSERLQKIGRELGIIYQIKDDDLDLFRDQSKTGKPDKSDIKENKKTFHRKILLESVEDDSGVKELLNGHTSDEEAEKVLEMMEAHEVEEKISREIDERRENLERLIGELENEELTESIRDTVEKVVEREK